MLVLSRKVREEIVIGEKIRISLLRIGRGQVRLGVEAPRDQGIRRGELAKRKQESGVRNQESGIRTDP